MTGALAPRAAAATAVAFLTTDFVTMLIAHLLCLAWLTNPGRGIRPYGAIVKTVARIEKEVCPAL
jgi:hypothetical protein